MYIASYDYGSPIKENRFLGDKYQDLKKQALFLRSTPDFYETDWVGNSSSTVVKVNSSDVLVTQLKSRTSASNYYIARQTNSSSVLSYFHL